MELSHGVLDAFPRVSHVRVDASHRAPRRVEHRARVPQLERERVGVHVGALHEQRLRAQRQAGELRRQVPNLAAETLAGGGAIRRPSPQLGARDAIQERLPRGGRGRSGGSGGGGPVRASRGRGRRSAVVSPRRPPLGLVSRLRRLRVVSLASGACRRRLRVVVASRHPFRLLRRFVSGPQLRLEPQPPLRVRSHRGVHPNRSQELELALEPPQNRPVPLGLRGEPSLKRLPLPAYVLVVRVGVVPRRVHRQRLRLDLRHERRARRKPRLARAERRRGVEPPKDADPLAPRERPHARRRRRRQRVVAEQTVLGRARTVVVAFGFGGFGGVAFGGGLDARARSVHLDGDVRRERGGRGARLEEALAVEEDVAARLLGGG